MLFHLDTSDSEGSDEDGTPEAGTTATEHASSVGDDEQARLLLGCLMDDIEKEEVENAEIPAGEDVGLSGEGNVYICSERESVQD